ncbi:MAG: helix-turn-helix domain-containing protein [Clostridiales bacterium]|nr:helix-turn-helix domain-containing protein [Clostridiales bacterium]
MDNATKTAEREAKRAAELEEMKVYNLTEIEPILGVTHRTLLTYIKDGRLKCVKIGGKWKVSGENLRKFINGES